MLFHKFCLVSVAFLYEKVFFIIDELRLNKQKICVALLYVLIKDIGV